MSRTTRLPPSSLPPSSSTVTVDPHSLQEASSSFLHLSLAPPSSSSSSAFNTITRSKTRSNEDLRLPPDFKGASIDLASAGKERGRGRGGPGSGLVIKGNESGSSVKHPFEGSQGLLIRRCKSGVGLVGADDDQWGEDEEDEDEEDDFSSDEETWRIRPPSVVSSSGSVRSSRIGVRMEDRSSLESPCFARDVTIRGFYSVGEKASGFVVFDCEIKTSAGTTIRTLKRYSAFVRLRNELIRVDRELRKVVPRLPPKSGLSKFRPSFLETRRQQLCYWLTTVLLHPQTGGLGIVRAWICEA